MRKGKNRYIVEVNEWGCGLMIKDTQTGNEIDAPEDEVITLCIKEMNSLAKELDTVRSVAQDNQDELKATRIENARLKAEVERLRASSFVTAVPSEDYEKLKAENERLRKAGDAMAIDCAEWCMSDQCTGSGFSLEETMENLPSVIAWNAAKQPPTDQTK